MNASTIISNPRIIVSLDFSEKKQALYLIDQLDPTKCRLKVGKELFTAYGPHFVKQMLDKQFDVFLDLKFHDIPNTVARACRVAADLGVWMLNVHALGGVKMLEAAQKALEDFNQDKPLLIAVTVLTSLDDQALNQIGFNLNTQQLTEHLAHLAYQLGLAGVVCSAREANRIKEITRPQFLTVTPGIRSEDDQKNDQLRTLTPVQAIKNQSDYLVIGRPITQAKNPAEKLEQITIQINAVTSA